MPRYIFSAGSVTGTGQPQNLTFWKTSTTQRDRYTDLCTVSGGASVDPIGNGVIIADATGAYSSFAGPDDVAKLYVQDAAGNRTLLTSSTTDASPGGGTSTYAPIGRALAGGASFAATGDSITIANSDNANDSHADSWATHVVLSSGGSLRLVANAGHGGYTSTQLLALLQSEVIGIADPPKVVGVLWGTNDSLDGSNKPTTTAANDRAAIAALRAAGIFAFMGTIPPGGMPALSAPAAPTVTGSATGGTMAAGTYWYKATYTNGAGETTASAATSVTTTGSTSSVAVDVPFVEGSTGAKVYVSTDNATWHLIGTLTGSGQSKYAQRYTDTTGSIAGATPPGSNTTSATPAAGALQKIAAINAWRRAFCAANGIPLVDFHALLVDPATGNYKQGYSSDGTHPTTARQKAMGQAAWTALSPYFPPAQAILAHDSTDPSNLFANGTFATGSASLPTGYASYGGSASGFTDTLGTKAGFLGQALQCARSIPDVRFHDSSAFSTGFSVGDVLRVTYKIQTEGAEAGGGNAGWRLHFNGANVNAAWLTLNAVDVGPGVWTRRVVVPAATTSIYFAGPYISAGVITASVGQVSIYNETTGAYLPADVAL